MMEEKLMVQKVLKGDNSAFGYFVDTYQNMALTIAYRICQNRQDAEDIVQNSYVKAYHNIHTFRMDSKFSTWFFRIVYNTALSFMNLSLTKNEYLSFDDIGYDNVDDDWDALLRLENQDRIELINKVLNLMPTDEALVLTLFYLDENSIKDIMQITSFTESNVKVKLHRARKSFTRIYSELNSKSVY